MDALFHTCVRNYLLCAYVITNDGNKYIMYTHTHEGNTQLCYAGYPTWNIGSYLPREPVDGGEDVGVDWRTKLTTNEVWQYTWGVEGGGYPTLVVQINAPAESCGNFLACIYIYAYTYIQCMLHTQYTHASHAHMFTHSKYKHTRTH